MVDYDYNGPPKPKENGKCSMDCPYHNLDHMPGWPMVEECFMWDEEKHGKEPYYLADHTVCKPSLDGKQ